MNNKYRAAELVGLNIMHEACGWTLEDSDGNRLITRDAGGKVLAVCFGIAYERGLCATYAQFHALLRSE